MKHSEQKYILIAKKYAEALIEAATAKNSVDKVFEDLVLVRDTVNSSQELQNVSYSPAISKEDKRNIYADVFKDLINPETKNVLYLLIDNNRLNIVDTLVCVYEEMMNKFHNVTCVEVFSAVEIDADQKERLQNKLEQKLQQSVNVDYKLNPEILAGLVIKIGEKIIDSSLSSKMQKMKKQLA